MAKWCVPPRGGRHKDYYLPKSQSTGAIWSESAMASLINISSVYGIKRGSSLLGQSMHLRWWFNAISRNPTHTHTHIVSGGEAFRSSSDDDIFCQIRTTSLWLPVDGVAHSQWDQHLRRKSRRKMMHISLFEDRQPRWPLDWRDLERRKKEEDISNKEEKLTTIRWFVRCVGTVRRAVASPIGRDAS